MKDTTKAEVLTQVGPVERGQCFVVAVRVAEALAPLVDDEVRVVHGRPTGTGGETEGQVYDHAWVEAGRTVFDASNPDLGLLAAPLVVYYAIGNINADECLRYDLQEVRRQMVEQGHYGPWHK